MGPAEFFAPASKGKELLMGHQCHLSRYQRDYPDLVGMEAVIFGGGGLAVQMLRNKSCLPFQAVAAVIPGRESGFFEGIPVIAPDEIANWARHLVVAAQPYNCQAIVERLSFLEEAGVTIHLPPNYSTYAEMKIFVDSWSSGGQAPTGLFQSAELDRLGIEYETDKSSAYALSHDCLRKYDFFFRPWRSEELMLMELGVYNGGSLKTWAAYFPRATVVGVDIDADSLRYAEGRIKILLGDLSDEAFLKQLPADKCHLILDDASHHWEDQLSALFTLYPRMPSGGIYVLEDTATSFSPAAAFYSLEKKIPPFAVMELIADYLTGLNKPFKLAAGPGRKPAELRLSPLITAPYYHDEIGRVAELTEAVIFIDNSCLLIKKA